MKLIVPVSGRILLRQLRDGFMIAGALRFGLDFVPVETSLYPACLVEGQLRIGSQSIDGPLGGHDRYGSACNWLGQPIWRRTTDARQFTVRFVEAFPDANQWTVVAVGCGRIDVPTDTAGHAWMDIADGAATLIEAPMDARGEAMGGVLASPVWPARNRELYTTPNLPSWQRPCFVRHHELLARVGRGEITGTQARAEIAGDDEMFNLHAGSIDTDFCRFLAAQPQASTVEDFGPRSAEQIRIVEERSRTIVRELVAARRAEEIRELAAAVGVAA